MRAVRLEIGSLSHVELEAMRFAFDVVKRGTLADGARLEIGSTPGRAWCMPCGGLGRARPAGDACPRCGSHQLQVTGGEECASWNIEID